MNPGLISYDGLLMDDFLLPDMPQPFLPGIKNKHPIFYLGLPDWTYKEAEKKKNSPYPPPGSLAFYAGHFNAVEFNESHQEMPSPEKIGKWVKSIENIPFKICPRFYKGISDTALIDLHKMGITKDFIARMELFKDKLGTAFLPLPETYPVTSRDKLIEYLKAIPGHFDVSVEVSNRSWYSQPEQFHSFVQQLNNINKGLLITDMPGNRDIVHMQLSNATAFIRFHCDGDHELDLFRIEQWKQQLQSWYLQGLEKCYFFLHIYNKPCEEDFIDYVKGELKF